MTESNLFEGLLPLGVLVILLAGLKMILEHITRSKIINKGLPPEDIRPLLAEKSNGQFLSALKWGLVLVGMGGAVLLGLIVPEELVRFVIPGSMLLFGGLALIIYYFATSRKEK